MKKYLLTGISLILLISCISGCSGYHDPSEEMETVTVQEEADVNAFSNTEDSHFYLNLDDTKTDITGYVISCSGNKAILKSSILPIIGLIPEKDNKISNEVRHFKKNGVPYTFFVGSNIIYADGEKHYLSAKAEALEGLDFSFPLDAVLMMGYNRYHTERDGSDLYITLQLE